MPIETLNWIPVIGFAIVLTGIVWKFLIEPATEAFKLESYRRTTHYCEAVDFINERFPGASNKVLGHQVKRSDSAYRVRLLTLIDGEMREFEVSVLDVGNGYRCQLLEGEECKK